MKGIKVLLVDDEADFTNSMRRVLTRRGFDVDVASDGLSALPKIVRERFDVVVLDIKMPGMDGISVLAEIKRMHLPPQVIMLTGHFAYRSEEDAPDTGVFAHLLKPIPIPKLVDTIEAAALHGKTSAQDGASA